MHPLLQRLRERKLVQWGLAYILSVVCLLQFFGTLFELIDFVPWVYHLAPPAIAIICLVIFGVAWHRVGRT